MMFGKLSQKNKGLLLKPLIIDHSSFSSFLLLLRKYTSFNDTDILGNNNGLMNNQ